jgi:hypothetical protein
MQRCALALVMIALAAGTVAAQPMAGSPTFATMDRQDGESKVGASLGWTFFDNDGPGDVSALRVDIYGHYVGMSGLGGYGIIPLSFVFVDNAEVLGDEDESAIGNVEGGVLYVIPSGATDFVLRGGITLPTADDDGPGIFTNFLAGLGPRLTDVAAHGYPETFWLRLSASPIFRSGQFVVRLDGGVDFAVSTDNYDEPDPVLRLNVGGGVDTGTVAILGELVTIGNLGDNDSAIDTGPDEDFLHTLALSARFRAGSIEPGVALGFPLDDSVREFMDFFVVAGLQGRI